MRFILLAAAVTLSLGMSQRPNGQSPLPMADVEACQIEFTNPVDTSPVAGRWGGQIALYVARTDDAGSVVSLKRQVIEGREHLPPRVRLDQLEHCVRRWRFGSPGDFTISLLGGPAWAGMWVIDVAQGSRVFRLRIPVAHRDR
jgi:hypothetical protein